MHVYRYNFCYSQNEMEHVRLKVVMLSILCLKIVSFYYKTLNNFSTTCDSMCRFPMFVVATEFHHKGG